MWCTCDPGLSFTPDSWGAGPACEGRRPALGSRERHRGPGGSYDLTTRELTRRRGQAETSKTWGLCTARRTLCASQGSPGKKNQRGVCGGGMCARACARRAQFSTPPNPWGLSSPISAAHAGGPGELGCSPSPVQRWRPGTSVVQVPVRGQDKVT